MSDTKIRVRKATALLREDHETLRSLFASFEEVEMGDHHKRATIFEGIKREFGIHSQIEEEIFYPAVESGGDEETLELVDGAREDHQHADQLLKELTELGPGGDDFDATMVLLRDVVLQHAEDEQETLFPRFDELDPEVREQISETLASRKQQLSQEGIEEEPE